ncbi:hypothetical protein AV521_30695 [Streptomyces sp. IMTB 2501]|uniref:hypothetical protein n=1 Tax=Streptomyces sp. IMTB 2501 TaxID=1776340 RepID=UPI00096FAB9B|nr:hypothetical protein [Streptomyces sp. IMTB 2501]OLZ65773.1 hypothetical protein AV521_30695 [Streptomyces sp. IMTB 2501]
MAVLIAGIALGAWVVFGAPHDWHGGKALGRVALGLGCAGMISGSARLIFFDTSQDEAGARGEEA